MKIYRRILKITVILRHVHRHDADEVLTFAQLAQKQLRDIKEKHQIWTVYRDSDIRSSESKTHSQTYYFFIIEVFSLGISSSTFFPSLIITLSSFPFPFLHLLPFFP